jgi:lysophospholipase L1-like esterase
VKIRARVSAITVFAMLGSAAGWAAAVPAPAATTAFTGTWSVSPQSSSRTFAGQTIRQIVHTSIGGSQVRIQLSNVFGNTPLTIADAHVAKSAGGSSITAGTDKQLTFGGASSVTIPAGGLAISDAATYTVDALANLAVSFYVNSTSGPSTVHNQATQDNYIASGDVSAQTTISASTVGNYFYLMNVDVMNPNAEGAVVTLGASITDGVGSSQNNNKRWPNDLAVRLSQAGRTVGVLNQGISGNGLVTGGTGNSATYRFDRDVLAQPNVKWVIFTDNPVNDLNSGDTSVTASRIIAATQDLINRAHARGIKFICGTLTPFEGAGPNWNTNVESQRVAFDNWVRTANNGCDGYVDMDNATHDPSHPSRYLPAYDLGDHLHANEAGLQAMANAVNLSLLSTGTTTPPPPAAPVVSFRAHANGKYVSADNAGANPLIANKTAIGSWEQFDELDAGNGNIALRAHANGKLVCADNAGANPLIANRTAIGGWETFQLLHNADGSVSLKAQANGKYVTAESGGASALIANRTAIGPWEEFDLISS